VVAYNPILKTLAVSGGGTITLTGKTYFFSKITLSGNSTLKVSAGPVKIYVSDQADMAGGTIANMTGIPSNLQFYQYPYALPVGYTPTREQGRVRAVAPTPRSRTTRRTPT
jgi:hypothetical protein